MTGFVSAREFFKRFQPGELLILLQCIGCHPSNQKYLCRIEHLICTLLTIQKKDFGNDTPAAKDFQHLFNEIEGRPEYSFADLEDFVGPPQTKLLPLFWNNQFYYFFYGNYERPYEYWKSMIEMYFPSGFEITEGLRDLRELIVQSLAWQTGLLTEIVELDESFVDEDKLYVPSDAYLESLSIHFTRADKFTNSHIEFGALSEYSERMLSEQAPDTSELIESLFIKDGDHYIVLYPQLHYDKIFECAGSLAAASDDLKGFITLSFSERLENELLKHFKGYRRVFKLWNTSSRIDLLPGFELVFLFDLNKIFVFNPIPHFIDSGFTEAFKNANQRIASAIDDILKEKEVAIDMGHGGLLMGIAPENIEFLFINVFEIAQPLQSFALHDHPNWNKTWSFEFMDLKAVFGHIGNVMNFYKFLKEDKWICDNTDFPGLDEFIDRFWYFINNGKSYSRMAELPEMIYFAHHQWSKGYFDELHRKFEKDFRLYNEIEKSFSDYFDNITNYRGNVYMLRNSIFNQSIFIVQLADSFVEVYLAEDPLKLSYKDYRIGFEVFAPMFADYIGRLDKGFQDFLGFNNQIAYTLQVFPVSYIKNEKEKYPFISSRLNSIIPEKPYLFYTIHNRTKRILVTFFIYDPVFAFKVFKTEQNEGERNLLTELLEDVGPFTREDNNRHAVIELVESVLPLGKKGYAMDELEIDNPEIEMYDEVVEFTPTDQGVIKRMVAAFLKTKNYNTGTYEGEKAKTITYEVFTYLHAYLEEEVKKYNDELLTYAYTQLENGEGHAEKGKLNIGMKLERQLDYDIIEKMERDIINDTANASAIRYILHTCLKVGNTGNRYITNTDWTVLLAIAEEIIQVAMIYDYIDQGLREHVIQINQYFEVIHLIKNENLKTEAYIKKDVSDKVSVASNAFAKASGLADATGTEENPSFIAKSDQVDQIFIKDFGVSYNHIVMVLYILAKLDYTLPRIFPLYIAEKLDLINEIRKLIIIEISLDEINSVLDFLTLKEGTFKSNSILYHEVLMRTRHRITISPLVQMSDQQIIFGREVIDGSMRLWNNVSSGWSPWQVEENCDLDKCLKGIRTENALILEKESAAVASKVLGTKYVESRIDNFKRLSATFKSKEDCGEIDLLCVNVNSKIIIVFDCKNHLKKLGLYQAKRNIEQFFFGKKSNYQKLIKKSEFIRKNLKVILEHFDISEIDEWKVKEGFITTTVHFAAFYQEHKVDFVLFKELERFLNN